MSRMCGVYVFEILPLHQTNSSVLLGVALYYRFTWKPSAGEVGGCSVGTGLSDSIHPKLWGEKNIKIQQCLTHQWTKDWLYRPNILNPFPRWLNPCEHTYKISGELTQKFVWSMVHRRVLIPLSPWNLPCLMG